MSEDSKIPPEKQLLALLMQAELQRLLLYDEINSELARERAAIELQNCKENIYGHWYKKKLANQIQKLLDMY